MHTHAPSSVDLTSAESGVRARAVFGRTVAAWGLTHDEAAQLLGLSPVAYHTWMAAPTVTLTPEILQRLSYVFGIHADLAILLPAPGRGAHWLRQPNHAGPLAGSSALTYLLQGGVDHLAAVRAYLAAQLN